MAEPVAVAAAAPVAIPALAAAANSVLRPGLHGLTDLLVAIALVAAWTTGT